MDRAELSRAHPSISDDFSRNDDNKIHTQERNSNFWEFMMAIFTRNITSTVRDTF